MRTCDPPTSESWPDRRSARARVAVVAWGSSSRLAPSLVLMLAYGLLGGGSRPALDPSPAPPPRPSRPARPAGFDPQIEPRLTIPVRPESAWTVVDDGADRPGARLLPRRRRIHRLQRRPDGRRAARRLRPGPRGHGAAAPGRPHRLDPGPPRPRVGRTLRTDGRGSAGDRDRRHRDVPIRRAQGPDRPVHRYRPGLAGTSSPRTGSGSSSSSCRIDRCSSSSTAGPSSSTPASGSSRICSARSSSRTAARRPDRRPKRSKHHRQPISKEGLQCPGSPCFPLPCSCY